MKRAFTVILFLLCAIAQADTSYVKSVKGFGTPTTDPGSRPNVGLYYTNNTGTTVTITQLGRWVRSGNHLPHTLSIYSRDTTPVLLASVLVDCSGATPNQFLYGTLSPAYDVTVGKSVYITSSEVSGGDFWCNNNNTVIDITDDIGGCQSAYVGSTGFIAGNNGGTYTSAGPVSFKYSSPTHNWTKTGTTYTLGDCELYTLNSAIADASTGDTINGPAGTATWGVSGYGIRLNKAVHVRYAGTGSTTINVSSTAPRLSAGGAINISAAGDIGGFAMVQSGSGDNPTAIAAKGASGWRITDINYTSAASAGYFLYTDSFGLLDHTTINGLNNEWIYMRGALDAWTTAPTLGTANALYLENNIFNGIGYFDANSNAKIVARFNTNTATTNVLKYDVHGYSTNSPAQSTRGFEFYNNTWTNAVTPAFEIRGGSGMVFNNTTAGTPALYITDYGFITNLTSWGNYQTPSNYPLFEQIGRGRLQSIPVTSLVAYQRAQVNSTGTTTDWRNCGAASAAPSSGTQFTATGPGTGNGTAYVSSLSQPTYLWGNKDSGGSRFWPRAIKTVGVASVFNTNAVGYSIGATSINLTSRATPGSGNGAIGVGDAVVFSGPQNDTTRYLVTSGLPQLSTTGTVTISPGLTKAIVGSVTMTSGPLTSYQRQTGNTSATFTERDIIQANRDFYANPEFDTTSGVVVGLFANMGTAVGKTGQGYWATDMGSWNTENGTPGTPGYQKGNGQLYVSNGATWDLYYTPYVYPHPLQGSAPYLISASINTAGTQLALVWSESCTAGAGGTGGVTITPSGGASTATYSSGSGSNTWLYGLSRPIGGIETAVTGYTQPGNGIEATSGGADVASYSGSSVTNNSTAGAIINATTINVTNLIIGP